MSTAANVNTASEVAAWHAVSVDEVAKRLGTDIGKGPRSGNEVASRLHFSSIGSHSSMTLLRVHSRPGQANYSRASAARAAASSFFFAASISG
jgi:hypothetical protein